MTSVFLGSAPQPSQSLRASVASALEASGTSREEARKYAGVDYVPPVTGWNGAEQPNYPPALSTLGHALADATPPPMPAMATAAGLVPLMSLVLNQQGSTSPMSQIASGIGNLANGYQLNGIPRAALQGQLTNQAAANSAAGAPGL